MPNESLQSPRRKTSSISAVDFLSSQMHEKILFKPFFFHRLLSIQVGIGPQICPQTGWFPAPSLYYDQDQEGQSHSSHLSTAGNKIYEVEEKGDRVVTVPICLQANCIHCCLQC